MTQFGSFVAQMVVNHEPLFLMLRKRTSRDDPVLNESDIHSGDFFGVLRLDGLDPMLAFGMGSQTGHTTVALWEETWREKGHGTRWDLPVCLTASKVECVLAICDSKDGQLYIAESTPNSSYWWDQLGLGPWEIVLLWRTFMIFFR